MELKLFTAEWCGSCSSQKEMLEDYDATSLEVLDVDENQDVANQYSVRSLPTLVLLDEGGPVKMWNGVTQSSEIEQTVAELR